MDRTLCRTTRPGVRSGDNTAELTFHKILEHLKLWDEPEPRPPPLVPDQVDIQYVPLFDS